MRDIKHFYSSFILYLVVTGISACTLLKVAVPETFNQKLAYAYGSVTSVRLVAKDLLASKSITAKEAQDIQDDADSIRATLDTARQLSDLGEVVSAEVKLKSAQSRVVNLQEFLKLRGGNI